MSLVLSFMVVWDFPTIALGMQSLRSSRLRAFYTEVAPTFTVFGSLFGKALQAQVALNALDPLIALNVLSIECTTSALPYLVCGYFHGVVLGTQALLLCAFDSICLYTCFVMSISNAAGTMVICQNIV